mmetsp:Transcript_46914/g.151416  ORF Transcript_46914/g.151416 Transcript_46914/m.151416 type:complete len:250 (+) Transcript_46914:1273-2022(+)
MRPVARRPPERPALEGEAADGGEDEPGGGPHVEGGVGGPSVEYDGHADAVLEDEEGGQREQREERVRHHRRGGEAGEGGDLERQQHRHHRELVPVRPARVGRVWRPGRRATHVLRAHAPCTQREEEGESEGGGEVRQREEGEEKAGRKDHRKRHHEDVRAQAQQIAARRREASLCQRDGSRWVALAFHPASLHQPPPRHCPLEQCAVVEKEVDLPVRHLGRMVVWPLCRWHKHKRITRVGAATRMQRVD